MIAKNTTYPTFDLSGKVALVTGSSRGLGSWIALALAHAGAHVVVTYRKALEEGEAVAKEIREMGRRCLLIPLDLADLSSIEAVMSEIIGEFGRLDILVNNAGVNRAKKALQVTPEDFDLVAGVNLRGVFFCSQAAAKIMIQGGGGKIINLSSAAAFLVRPNIAISVYAMTKAGLVMLTKALASEWAEHKINVNAVAPGYFKTPLTQDRLEDPRFKKSVLETTPLNRVGEPQDIMGAVMFLASGASDFITGQTLCVDGGRTVL